MGDSSTPRIFRFGVYELDPDQRQLYKSGRKIRLQDQPFDVLCQLIERPGKIVTREELRQRLWSHDTFIDFDHGLNTAINKIREALGDSAGDSRYIGTVPRRGYRFIAPVDALSEATPDDGVDCAGEVNEREGLFSGRRRWLNRESVLLAGVVAAATVALTLWLRPSAPVSDIPFRRFVYAPAELLWDDYAKESSCIISPNGRHIAYVAGKGEQRKLWIQDLDRRDPRPIEASEGVVAPFWSPGSDFIGFYSAQELKIVPVEGGRPRPLCNTPTHAFGGASWSPVGDQIVFSSGMPMRLYGVSAQGGDPQLLLDLEPSEEAQIFTFPHFLPPGAGPALLFATGESCDSSSIALLRLDTGKRTKLANGVLPFFDSSGRVLYQPEPTQIWALPFSLDRLEANGKPFPVAKNARSATTARDGTLVYLEETGFGRQQLVWLDRSGRKVSTIGQPQVHIEAPTLSPDGRRVAVFAWEQDRNWCIWAHEVDRPVKTRVTFDAGDDRPIWTPSSDRVTYASLRNGSTPDIFVQSLDGNGEPEPLFPMPGWQYPYDWSPDSKYLAFQHSLFFDGYKVSFLERSDDGKYAPVELFHGQLSNGEEDCPDFSPDGRFLAFQSNESGRFEVYVRPFPDGPKLLVSTDGGGQPRWRGDGRELFYVKGESLYAVLVAGSPSFSSGAPHKLFDCSGCFDGLSNQYDVSADGQRFVVVETLEETPDPVIRVVQNWAAEFRDR